MLAEKLNPYMQVRNEKYRRDDDPYMWIFTDRLAGQRDYARLFFVFISPKIQVVLYFLKQLVWAQRADSVSVKKIIFEVHGKDNLLKYRVC
jgi:hypothetical protein